MAQGPCVLILGGGRYYLNALKAAQEYGCQVVIQDRDPHAPGLALADHAEVVDIVDMEGSLQVARKYGIDAVIPLNDYGVPTAAFVAEQLNLTGISREAACHATSKALMRQCWQRDGVPSVRFRIAGTLTTARQAAEELDTWPLILKPVNSLGGGSRGVSRLDGLHQLQEAWNFAQEFYPQEEVIIEECLTGLEHSMETMTIQGQTHVLAVADKEKTMGRFRVDRSVIYPSVLQGRALETVCESAKAAIRSLGIDFGPAHVELCSTPQGPRLFEIGARCGGGHTPDPIIPWVTGIEMFKEVIRLYLGDSSVVPRPLYQKGGVYRFLMPSPGILQDIQGLEEVRQWPGILDAGVFLNPGSRLKNIRTGHDRAGFVVAGCESRAEAIALADRAEKKIIFTATLI